MPQIVHVGYRSPFAASMAWLRGIVGFTPRTPQLRVIKTARH